MPAPLLALLLSLYFLAALNRALWRALMPLFSGHAAGGPGFFASLCVLLLCYQVLLFTALLWPRVGKPLVVIVLLVSAAAAYFMDSYRIALDLDMVQNVFQTNASEAAALLTPALVWHVLLLGALPAALLCWVRIGHARSLGREALRKVLTMMGTVAVAALLFALSSKHYIYFARNHRDLYDLFNPYNYLSSSVRAARHALRSANAPLAPLGRDARLPAAGPRRQLVVLVVGETARAQNQSLGGYPRDTNPELTAAGVSYFTDAHSCGTATAVSVPCMFSNLTRAHYRDSVAAHTENLLDVLQHASVAVRWRDNDNGCKGVCNRVPHEDLSHATIPGICAEGDCLDAILLRDLPAQLAPPASSAPRLLVLHIKGSHGPAYYRRYPPAFARFKPTCDTAEVQTCDRQSIVNSYDNGLLYTDHVLGTIIAALRQVPDTDTALIYLSDHGESLGENGVYLHGMDYRVAPQEQTHIPMLLWFSDGWKRSHPQQVACVAARVKAPAGQDNLFDTVLGLFGVQTAVHRPALDLGAACGR